MEKKLKLINKISNWSMIVLLLSLFLNSSSLLYQVVSVGSCCTMYICILLRNKINLGKFDPLLILLCLVSVFCVILRAFYTNPYLNILGMIFIYCFLLWSSKISTGAWNKLILLIAPVTILSSVLRIYFTSPIITWGIVILQLVIIGIYLDPILEKIALEHRRKRLEAEGKGTTES